MTQKKSGPVVKQVDITSMVFKNFVMGGTAGIIGATSCYPLDIIKTRLQNQTVIPGQEPMYKGVGDAFKKILARDGVRGLYRGLPAQLVGITPEKAIKLSANDLLRYLFTNKETGEIKVWQEMVSGSLAGFSQVVVTNPYELVKVRLQTAAPGAERKTIMSVVKEVGGVQGLFRGAGACLLRDVPFSAIYFTLFGNFKRMASDENGHITLLWSFACGCFAGTISAATVTPADVVKTRLQVAGSEAKYSGISDCFSKILKEEGPRALFKGAIPRVLIISPLFGITLATYEFMKGLFE